jgi:translocation and assembly module TamB
MSEHVPKSKLWVSSRRARRPWRKVVWTLLLLILGSLLLFLPNLLGTFMPNQLLAVATRSINGHVTASSLSLGWFQPIILNDVIVAGRDGETVLEAKEMRTEKTLLGLLTSPRDLGRFHVRQPQLHVVTWADGSNIEQLLAPMFAPSPPGSGLGDQMQIGWDLEDGEVDFRSPRQAFPVSWSVSRLTGSLSRAKTVSLNLETSVSFSAGDQRGDVRILIAGGGAAQGGGLSSFEFDARGVPLAAFQPLVSRFTRDGELRGNFDGMGRLRLDLARGTGQLDDLLATVSGFEFQAPGLLGEDVLQSDQLRLRGELAWSPEQWQVTGTRLDTDFGHVQLRGQTRPLPAATSYSSASLTSHLLAHSTVVLAADLDFARLANMLPQLLRRRDDVTIDAARLALDVSSREADAGGINWQAAVTTTDVRATRSGTPIVWDAPIEAMLSGRWLVDHLEVDELSCRSDFLTATFEGTAESGTVDAEINLHRMLARAAELFDVEGIDAGGEISGQLKWTQRKQQVELDGRVWLDDFIWNFPDRPAWRETQLALRLALKLQQDPDGSIAGVPSATFDLTAPAERVIAKLRRPVAAPWESAEWSFDLEAGGRVERWKPRLQPLVDLTDVEMAGLVDLQTRMTIDPRRVDVESLTAELEQFLFARQAVRVEEPQVVVQLTGEWSRVTGSWRSEKLQLQTSTVSASSDNFQVLFHAPQVEAVAATISTPAGRPSSSAATEEDEEHRGGQIRGDLHFFSDLARLQNWFATPQSRTNRVEGELRGVARFSASGQGSRLNLQMDVTSFQLLGWREFPAAQAAARSGSWQPLWSDPKLTLRGEGELDMGAEKLSLADFRLTGEGIAIRGEGTLDDLSGRMVADVQGELQYNLRTLSEKLRKLSVEQLSMTGQKRQSFSLRGPLRRASSLADGPQASEAREAAVVELSPIIPRELQGMASFGWDSMDVLAIPIGSGQVRGQLRDARVDFSAVNIPVSGGQLTARPVLDFTRPPARLEFPSGPLLTDLQITPPMCRSWLLYVAPLVADATSAEGQFSLQIDRLSMPLGNAEQADISGALVIQDARIGPGPLAQRLVTLARNIPAILGRQTPSIIGQTDRWVRLPAQVVAFDVEDGRVSHKQLEMRVGDIRVTTTGWVDLDQTMSLTVQVWIRDEWLQGRPLLEGLRGRSISIPVSGSLSRPQVDDRVLTDLSRQAIGSAAGGLLRDLLRQRSRD